MPPRPTDLVQALPILPIGDSSVPGVTRIIGLANNENSEAPSDAVLRAVGQAAEGANRYPDIGHSRLRGRIAEAYGGLDPDRIVCGIGSSELIGLLAQCYCGPGDETLIGRQGYLYFAIATLAAGAKPVQVGSDTLGNRPGFDPDAILEAVTPKTRIVFLDNPSNPLGTFVDWDTLRAFRAALREDILLVLDAAYADYVTDSRYQAGEALVVETENTVCLRTFSKIYGLAGMRVGWAYAPAAIAETLHRIQRPGNIATCSLAAAETAILEQELISERRLRNGRIRDAFAHKLAAFKGVSILPSQTNFIFASFTEDARIDAASLFEQAKARGVILRPMGPYGQPDSLRITIGTDDEMAIAATVLGDLLG